LTIKELQKLCKKKGISTNGLRLKKDYVEKLQSEMDESSIASTKASSAKATEKKKDNIQEEEEDEDEVSVQTRSSRRSTRSTARGPIKKRPPSRRNASRRK